MSFARLLVSFTVLLVNFAHLLVSFARLLVNYRYTHDFALFTRELPLHS
ncbi:hypothetical protein ACQKKK_06090 [Peribacillus sp. NPDC006672]